MLSNIPINPVIGSTVTLTCTVELSPAVDVSVAVNITWTGPHGFRATDSAQPVMGSTTNSAIVNSFGREQSGIYTCTATVAIISNSMSSFVSTDGVSGTKSTLVNIGKLTFISFMEMLEDTIKINTLIMDPIMS